MKLNRIIVFGVFVIAIAWGVPSFAADAIKIGVVDFRRFLPNLSPASPLRL
jgi:hypothetical protein